MTVENIAGWAQRKGLDLLGTGDCLQTDWLRDLEAALCEAEPGFFKLRPNVEEAVAEKLPSSLHRSLRYVLSTEVCCLPPPRKEIEGIHYLLYFPSFERARAFQEVVAPHGNLREGRPTLNLNALELLERLETQGADCHLAPAHIFNPWFSALGVVGGGYSLQELFGDFTSQLLAAETGLTSTPRTCRRLSSLDSLGLFSCSDAHSLEKLGREYTVVDIEPNYHALFAALRDGSTKHVVQTVKFPLQRTRYYLNRCSHCQRSFDANTCPVCGRRLVDGSRDRLEKIADRPQPIFPENAPPFQELLPLTSLIAEIAGRKADSEPVKRLHHQLIETLGHERYILTEAREEEIAAIATPQLARAVAAQRTATTEYFAPKAAPTPSSSKAEQAMLGF